MRRLMIVIVAGVLTGCVTQPNVEVYLTNLTPMPSTLFEQRVKLDLRIQNLTEQPIEATGLDVALRVNDKRLARGVDAASFTVPRLGDATASVVVSTSVFDTIRQILGLQDRQTFSYTLKGRVITPGIDQRFSRSGEISRTDLQALVRAE